MTPEQPTLFDLPPEQPKREPHLPEKPQTDAKFIAVVRQIAGQKSPEDRILWRTHDNGENEYITRGELDTTTKKPRRWNTWQAARRYLSDNYHMHNITIEIYRED